MGSRRLLAIASFLTIVISLSARAAEFKSPLTQIRVAANLTFGVQLSDLVKSVGPDVRWAIDSTRPDWLIFDTAHLGGTPTLAQAGTYNFNLYATDSQGAAQTKIELSVVSLDENANPLDLGTQSENSYFQFDLKSALLSRTQHTSFTSIDAPGWLKVTADGVISGIPQAADVGTYTFSITLKNDAGVTSVVEVIGLVAKVLEAPRFIGPTLVANDARINTPYALNVAGAVSAGSARTFIFSLISGPAWLQVNSQGILTGTPSATDAGAVAVRIKLRTFIDGMLYEDTTLIQFNVL